MRGPIQFKNSHVATRRRPLERCDHHGHVMKALDHSSLLRVAALFLTSATLLSATVEATSAAVAAPTVTTTQASGVHPTSATANGVVNPNGTATNWYIQYGLSTNAAYGSQTASKSAGSGTNGTKVAASLVGLTPASSYHYRVVASSSAGTTYGGDSTFNTSAGPVVVTIAASHVTSSSAFLNAVVNPEGLTTTWYFQFGLTATYGSRTAKGTLAAGPNDVSVTSAVANLTVQATYHFRIVASNSAGVTHGADLVVVTGEPITLTASPATVTYGQYVTLSGRLDSGLSGQAVTLMSERFDETAFSGLATTTTSGNGVWSYMTKPTARTTYKAIVSAGPSSPVVVSVRPTVSLNVSSTNQLSTRVVGAISFGFHILQLQRLSLGTWVTWKSVRLNASGRATFATSLPKGRTTIRMAIGPFVVGIDQAAPGYLAGISRTLIYKR